MQVTNSIQKAREKNIDDALIFQEIRKQNPKKESFFKKAEEMGATPTQILNEIIKQNPIKKENEKLKEKPVTPPAPHPSPKIEKKVSLVPDIKKTPFEIESKSFSDEKSFSTPLTPKNPAPNIVTKDFNNTANTTGKTILTKEAQEREEEMRNQFLKRIEAKEKGENIEGENFFTSSLPSSDTMQGGKIKNNNIPEKTTTTKILVIIVIILFLLAVGLLFFSFL